MEGIKVTVTVEREKKALEKLLDTSKLELVRVTHPASVLSG